MLFAIVVALYFSVLLSIAAVMEFCLFRLDDFRRTQRSDYPAICHLIDRIWCVLHLSIIFDCDDDPAWEEDAETASLSSHPDVRDFFCDVSHRNQKAAWSRATAIRTYSCKRPLQPLGGGIAMMLPFSQLLWARCVLALTVTLSSISCLEIRFCYCFYME